MIHVPQSTVTSPSNTNASDLQRNTSIITHKDIGLNHPALSTSNQLNQMEHMYNLLLNPTSSSRCSETTTAGAPLNSTSSSPVSASPDAFLKKSELEGQSQSKYFNPSLNGNIYTNQFVPGVSDGMKYSFHFDSEHHDEHHDVEHCHSHHEMCSNEACESLSSLRSRVAASPSSLSSRSSLLSCGSFSSQSPSVSSSHESSSSRSQTTAASCHESSKDPVVGQGTMNPNHPNITPNLCRLHPSEDLGYPMLTCGPPGLLSSTRTSGMNDPRLMVSSSVAAVNGNQLNSCSNLSVTNTNHSMHLGAPSCPIDLFSPRNPFTLVPTPQMYRYSPSMLTHPGNHVHHPSLPTSTTPTSVQSSHGLNHSPFPGLLSRFSPGPAMHATSTASFPPHANASSLYSTRDPSLPTCGAFHPVPGGGGRYIFDTPSSRLSDETLPTYPNAAAAPNRLPAHKPVRLTHPKHPLAPQGTPVYFKYGEEHYPEETVPAEYTFTETDGTVCRYITNFLVYNKRGERLLPIEVLDQPRHAALVLYGSLLPADVMSQGNCRLGKRPSDAEVDHMRGGKKRGAAVNGLSALPKRHTSGTGANCMNARESCRGNLVAQSYPVRVELAEWCIDYGQEPSNVPFIWLISRWDVYYRLEKPAGRYIPTFATAKMKFEVSTRVIKTLQHRPDTGYKALVNLLTAATRLEKFQNRAQRRAMLEKERRARLSGNALMVDSHGYDMTGNISSSCSDPLTFCSTHSEDGGNRSKNGAQEVGNGPQGGTLTKKKNRNWRIQSLSTPQGTGVILALEDGRPQAVTSWGAPYAVDGFKESMLLGLTEFLESQLRNFMDGVGSKTDGGSCADLLNTPFMRTLRERTALRMEALQLMEAKRRALEVAKSLAEAASGHSTVHGLAHTNNALESGGSASLLTTPTHDVVSSPAPHAVLDSTNFMPFSSSTPGSLSNPTPNGFSLHSSESCHYFHNMTPHAATPVSHAPSPYFSGVPSVSGAPGTAGLLGNSLFSTNNDARLMVTNNGIATLESEIQHLQQFLKDSDDDEDEEEEGEEDNEDDEEDEEDKEGRGAEHGNTEGREHEDDRDDEERDNDEPDDENDSAEHHGEDAREESEPHETKKIMDSEITDIVYEKKKNTPLRNRHPPILYKRKTKDVHHPIVFYASCSTLRQRLIYPPSHPPSSMSYLVKHIFCVSDSPLSPDSPKEHSKLPNRKTSLVHVWRYSCKKLQSPLYSFIHVKRRPCSLRMPKHASRNKSQKPFGRTKHIYDSPRLLPSSKCIRKQIPFPTCQWNRYVTQTMPQQVNHEDGASMKETVGKNPNSISQTHQKRKETDFSVEYLKRQCLKLSLCLCLIKLNTIYVFLCYAKYMAEIFFQMTEQHLLIKAKLL